MIVWGGTGSSGLLNTGGRYNPSTDSWTATSTTNAPDARFFHTAVWTGSEMIVWSGDIGNDVDVNTGGRYCAQAAPSPTPTPTPSPTATPTPTASPIQLILDQSGPALDQVAALDSLIHLRDPFSVVNDSDFLNLGSDRNTRLVIFVTNLTLAQGESSSSVVINLIDSNNQSHDIAAEDVRQVPNFDFTQVIFRFPDNLPPGKCIITVRAHGQVSNSGSFRIRI